MKVYIVEQSSGSYDDYVNRILKIFCDKQKAEEFAKKIDDEFFIPIDEIYTIVPRDIYEDWPCDDKGEYVNSYYGYTYDEFIKQDERVTLTYMEYSPCTITEYEVN